jgi:hypothetical protein
MKTPPAITLALLVGAGCASSTRMREPNVPPSPVGAGPNWAAIDRTIERVKKREQTRLRVVKTERRVEAGFFPMTDEDYAQALDAARAAVKKAQPKLAEAETESEAVRQAEEARRRHEQSFTQRTSSTFELKKP